MHDPGGRRKPRGIPSLKAVAVDLGASSARIALGTIEGGTVTHQTVEQIEHVAVGRNWDLPLLSALCRRAWELAHQEGASLGIDSWGVDVGILLEDGEVLGPVCYRDSSHGVEHVRLAERHAELFAWTGVAAQPFNTVFQLAARAREDPSLPERAEWLLLPDLLAHWLGAPKNFEATIASTTQLVGLDGNWSTDAFEVCGWPVPALQPRLGGVDDAGGVPLVRVAGHDTASAVRGLGPFGRDEAFVNLGTWTLVGMVVPEPIVSAEALRQGWTNELDASGKTRLLKNVPGFYIANRIHAELFPDWELSPWLDSGHKAPVFDVHDLRLFNPESMVQAVTEVLGRAPNSPEEWAGSLVASHAAAVAAALAELGTLVGTEVSGMVVGGGGSRCRPLLDQLSRAHRVRRGADEATVLGNLVAQFVARGAEHG